MAPQLICGPPNSGRTGLVLGRFVEALDRDPVLVVPTVDDVDRFERELCERGSAAGLGGTVTTITGLFGLVADACEGRRGKALSRIQRVWLARWTTRRASLRVLARSARREGFAPALEELLTDLQAAGLDAEAFAAIVAEAEVGAYEREIAALFAGYEELRESVGIPDEHELRRETTARLRAEPASWRDRPTILYGFDDLTREQIELVAALDVATEVTVALTYEDRPALAARAELLGILREELGGVVVAEPGPERSHTASTTLFELERSLFEPDSGSIASDGALTLVEASGERAEAELIGRRVAALISAGSDPEEIAVAVRNPDRQAPQLSRVLAGLGIPVAAEASIPLASTAVGNAILRLLALISGEGEPRDLVAFLRGPGRADPEAVDWLERRLLRERVTDLEAALAVWTEDGEREVWALERLREAEAEPDGALAEQLALIAADLAERPHLRSGVRPAGHDSVELRAAGELTRALGEIGELNGPGRLGGGRASIEEIGSLVGSVRVPLWRGATEGRVRILSPYRLRARRVSHLFVAGLLDGSFPAASAGQPLLSEDRRRQLGIGARRDPAAEERYLFYSCVSRPERSLGLSWSVGEAGAGAAPSPFVEEVLGLLAVAPGSGEGAGGEAAELSGTAGGVPGDPILIRPRPDELVATPATATSERDLCRALAATPTARRGELLAELELPAGIRETVESALSGALEGLAASASPGPLRNPDVLAHLSSVRLFGASTLEEYDLCSYRWFVNHELAPQPIEPDPEPLETGGIIHAALEALYREPPADRRPSEETIAAWSQAARKHLRREARSRRWDLEASRERIALARLDAVIERFLRRDAETGGPLQPNPQSLEVSFGPGEDDDHPAAELGGFDLHGRIDRIDVSTDGKALIRDYKLSTKVVAGARLIGDGKLQLPLYIRAVESMGLEPVGGLYHPLAATKDDRPRGLLAKEEKGATIPAGVSAHVGTDFKDTGELEEIVSAGVERANEIVSATRAGLIARKPRGGKCPEWCRLAPICRIERTVIDEEAAEEDEDAR